ncbi:MAG: hypothetical protein WD066_09110 [Planctomycetaceae bacterium]
MTPELERRWKAGRAPFDGSTVARCDEPDLGVVREALWFACEALREWYPIIHVFADWHEHDGFVTQPRAASWEEVFSWLASAESLYASRDDDDLVRVAIFPASFDWLLRYDIEGADDDWRAAWCDFDFTATPAASAFPLVAELHSRWPGYTDISPAKAFFDDSYGG